MSFASITADEFYDAAREVVAERPEFVYTPPKNTDPDDENGDMCRYVHEDEQGRKSCGCVVGAILNKLGVPFAFMEQREGSPASALLGAYFGFELSSSVSPFADELQYQQDAGCTWSAALAHAERYKPTGVIL